MGTGSVPQLCYQGRDTELQKWLSVQGLRDLCSEGLFSAFCHGIHLQQITHPTDGASLLAQMVKNLPAMQETWV